MQNSPDFSLVDFVVKTSVERDRLMIRLPFLLQFVEKCIFPCAVFEPLGVLLFGDDWDAVLLDDGGAAKQFINDRSLDHESDFLAHLLAHEILQKVAECPVVVIEILEQNIKLLPSDFAYVPELLHKKLKVKAHLLDLFLRVPKQVVIRQEILSRGQHRPVLPMQSPYFVVFECVLPVAKQSQLLVELELLFLYRIANGHV